MLTLAAQREWLNALATLEQIRSDAQYIVESADALEMAAFNALRYGREDN